MRCSVMSVREPATRVTRPEGSRATMPRTVIQRHVPVRALDAGGRSKRVSGFARRSAWSSASRRVLPGMNAVEPLEARAGLADAGDGREARRTPEAVRYQVPVRKTFFGCFEGECVPRPSSPLASAPVACPLISLNTPRCRTPYGWVTRRRGARGSKLVCGGVDSRMGMGWCEAARFTRVGALSIERVAPDVWAPTSDAPDPRA